MHVLVIATDHFNDEGRGVSGAFSIGSTSGGLPAGWVSQDIGDVSAAGSASYANGTFTVNGSGADIWGTADEFHFVHRSVSGNFVITARVASVEYVAAWTKAGIMIRDGLSPSARHLSFFATPSTTKGIAYQRRLTAGGLSANPTDNPAIAPPVWLMLARRDGGVWAYFRRAITDLWTPLYYEPVNDLADTLDVGLAVSSHADGTVATAQFTDVTVEPMQEFTVGSIASAKGHGSYNPVVYFLSGQGSDIWGTADSLYYGFMEWTGDGTITARVRDIQASSAWAKAGVMFRESTTPGSKHVFALLSPGHGAALQYRPTTMGPSASAGGISGAAPGWLRLTRAGDTFTASLSVDGRTWKTIGSVTVQMAQTLFVGFVHTSHNPDDGGGASFDDIRVKP